jgi:ATP-dependent DNA ligase
MNLPTLYKKSTTGKIEQWEVYVAQKMDGRCHVNSTFGEVGGKMQTTFDTITEGKNIGKKNETSVYEQACKEALSKWEKKKKKGYVESIEAAQAGEVDDLIEGGFEPMLAHVYEKHGDKIQFPCLAQPKLDGIRCIAIKKGPNVTLWSRTRKRITSCPHIEKSIAFHFARFENLILDGELYNHDLKHDFEKIVSAVRKENPTPEAEKVQYHIYDVVLDGTNLQRARWLTLNALWSDREPLRLVKTEGIRTEADISTIFKEHRKAGYEGTMLRNNAAMYESKRSYNLQKVKEFDDAEFEIVGVVEGKGKLQGLLGAFLCRTQEGTEFEVKMTGNQEETKKFLNDPTLCVGKLLTVQFQGLTGKNKVPRFPVGLRLREEGL